MSREEWWLDYVECELDSGTMAEMKSLLKHSSRDRELVQSLSETKFLLQQFAVPPETMSEGRLRDLHDRIMGAVESTEVQGKPRKLKLSRALHLTF